MKKRFASSLVGDPVRIGLVLLSAVMLLFGLVACSGSSAGTSSGTSSGSSDATATPGQAPGGAATATPGQAPGGAAAGPRLSFTQTSYEVGQVSRGGDKG